MKTPDIRQTTKIIGLLLAGLFFGWLLFGGSSDSQETQIDQHVEETHTDEEGNIVYTCSMHPQIRSEEPGNCPICGMELIPLDEAEEQENDVTLTMSEAAVKLAEIQTTAVLRQVPEVEVRMPGRVVTDERNVASVTARFSGRIEELFVDFRGTYVQEGEPLATVYSPELISAQRELIEAARNKEANPGLYESVRRKLQLWELPDSEIQRIEESGEITDALPIVASRSGYIIEKNVDAKDYVDEGTVMYKVADLSRLWVMFDAYETDLATVKTGHSVTFTVQSHPGKTFEADITYIDPFIDPDTRTARVRAEVDNPEGILKPDMLARGVVTGPLSESEELLVPRSAVMWTGKRSVVFVQHTGMETPMFEARLVTLGPRAGYHYVVEDGLEEGEQVVTNGNFKLDSAAQLADKLSMMNREPGSGDMPAGHDHGDMQGSVRDTENDYNSRRTSGSDSYNVSREFQTQLTSVVESYIRLNNSLKESDGEAASDRANEFLDQLNEVDMSLLDAEPHTTWMEQLGDMKTHAETIAGQTDIEARRSAFGSLSETLTEGIKTFGIQGEAVYQQYCPMAFNGEGAYWLSNEEEISNPYLADTMPGCGETIEKINS